MVSSEVPAVPCTNSLESPEIAAARCSASHDLATPGSPSSSKARSVASVATATSTRCRSPIYFGLTSKPLARRVPSRYSVTAHGDSRQEGGRARLSTAASCSSSSANSSSAWRRTTSNTGSAELRTHGMAVLERLCQPIERWTCPTELELELRLEQPLQLRQHARLESEMRSLEQRQRGVLPPRDQPWQPEHEKATEILAPRIAARVGKTGDRSRAELDQTTQD